MSTDDWALIRAEYEQGASLRKLALKYGVSKSLIGKKKFEEQWTACVDSGQPHTEHQRGATPKKETTQDIFLEEFSIHGNVTQACRVVRIDRSTLYRWKEHDEEFSLRYNQAFEEAKDNIRAEIRRRGHDGFDEQVLVGGKIHTIHKYSDTLLIFHAKMLMPEYREKQQLEVTGHIDVTGFKELLMQRLARLEESKE